MNRVQETELAVASIMRDQANKGELREQAGMEKQGQEGNGVTHLNNDKIQPERQAMKVKPKQARARRAPAQQDAVVRRYQLKDLRKITQAIDSKTSQNNKQNNATDRLLLAYIALIILTIQLVLWLQPEKKASSLYFASVCTLICLSVLTLGRALFLYCETRALEQAICKLEEKKDVIYKDVFGQTYAEFSERIQRTYGSNSHT